MANYLPIVLDSGPNNWLLRQREGSIHSWPQLRHLFIENYRITCQQPGTKYDLAKIVDYPNEPLRHYIRRFSEVWTTIPDISAVEVVSLFVQGLRQPGNIDLRKELLRRQPTTTDEMFRIAREFARVDDAMQQLPETGQAYRNFRKKRCQRKRFATQRHAQKRQT